MTNVVWCVTISLVISCQLLAVLTNAQKTSAHRETSTRNSPPIITGIPPTSNLASSSSVGGAPHVRSAAESQQRGEILTNSLKLLTNKPFNDFDWKLSKILNSIHKDNVIVSTVCVKLILGMLYLGAQDTIAKEIEKVFAISATGNATVKEAVIEKFSEIMKSLENSKDNEYELNIGTKFFFDKNAHVNESFKQDLHKYFNTEAEQVDFKQRETTLELINSWCNNMTQERIKNLITKEELTDSTVMILLNAIYFKGEWVKQFRPEHTKPDTFYVNGETPVTVPMMWTKEKFHYYNIFQLNTHLLRLPYVGKKFVMYLLVPHEANGLGHLARQLTPEILSASLNNMTEATVYLRLPRFKFESSSILVPVLRELGIKELFNPLANLTNIGWSNDGPLMISSILQKSGIEVNERGSTAYAATEVQIGTRFGEEAVEVKVSHPFVFLIADEERDSIIFIGKVVNPLSNATIVLTQEEISNKIKPEEEGELEDEILKERYSFFDKELLKELSASLPDNNVVVSPASIKSVLALLVEGSGGKTESQLKHALRLPTDKLVTTSVLQQQLKALKNKSPSTILNSQNKIYVAKSEKLLPEYQNNVKAHYYSDIENVDFTSPDATMLTINSWVNRVTEGLIPNLVDKDQFDAATKLFLVNCIYFKADWQDEFDEKNTQKGCFYNTRGECLHTYLMYAHRRMKFFYSRDLDAKVVELPFKDPRYSMVFMLPNQETGLHNLVKDLIHQELNSLLTISKTSRVKLTIPRTTVDFSSSLSKILEHMDIRDVFMNTANLSGILENKRPVKVKDIIHKAKIEINEKGAKAAAASEGHVLLLSAPDEHEFKANRPFLFFIRDSKFAGFLFEGLVVSPDHEAQARTAVPMRKPALTGYYPRIPTTRRYESTPALYRSGPVIV